MKSGVFFWCYSNQIFRSIIFVISIYMMNMVALWNWTIVLSIDSLIN